MKSRFAGLALAVAMSAVPAVAQDVDAETVLATVGDTEITLGHLIAARTTLPPQYQQLEDSVLYEGLLDQLIQQAALAQSLDPVTRATELTIQNQRAGLLAGEALGKVAAGAVTEAALQEAYEARFADAEPEEEFNASHILVESEEDALAVRAELDAGADFAEVAKTQSTGPSGPNGGALGWFSKGMMVPEFEAAVVDMEPGQVSDPVQTQFGWHIVKLNETRIKDAPPMADVRSDLAQELERAAVEAHIAEVVEAANVSRAEVEVDPALIRSLELIAD